MSKLAYLSLSIIPSRQANSVHVMKISQAFALNGFDVTLFHPKRDVETEGVQDVFDYYGVQKCFKLNTVAMSPMKSMRLFTWKYGRKVAQALQNGEYDYVYTRSMELAIVAQKLGMPVIFETHTSYESLNFLAKMRLKSLISSDHVKRVVVISDALKRKYTPIGEKLLQKFFVAHDAADEVDVRPKFQSLQDVPRVGYAGHLYEGRGIEVVVDLAQEFPDFEFSIAGGHDEQIQQWRAKTSNFPNIEYLGFLEPGQVPAFRESCSVLLAPYQRKVTLRANKGDTSEFMSPLKIFEYMSSGRPMIASDLPVLREVLRNGDNSMLCGPDDFGAWREALRFLRDNPEKAEKIGDSAFNDFSAHHTWRKRAQAVVANEFST